MARYLRKYAVWWTIPLGRVRKPTFVPRVYPFVVRESDGYVWLIVPTNPLPDRTRVFLFLAIPKIGTAGAYSTF